ncbi:MAG: hypothetical protein M0015_18170 [Betaproteobacteria bacterium]|nr:hypothetical protein [Betaproteobacteria bacterium]
MPHVLAGRLERLRRGGTITGLTYLPRLAVRGADGDLHDVRHVYATPVTALGLEEGQQGRYFFTDPAKIALGFAPSTLLFAYESGAERCFDASGLDFNAGRGLMVFGAAIVLVGLAMLASRPLEAAIGIVAGAILVAYAWRNRKVLDVALLEAFLRDNGFELSPTALTPLLAPEREPGG